MRRFAENTDTVNLFKEAALSKNFDNDGDCKSKLSHGKRKSIILYMQGKCPIDV